jgi:exodeoxyribonuclease VII large subunit
MPTSVFYYIHKETIYWYGSTHSHKESIKEFGKKFGGAKWNSIDKYWYISIHGHIEEDIQTQILHAFPGIEYKALVSGETTTHTQETHIPKTPEKTIVHVPNQTMPMSNHTSPNQAVAVLQNSSVENAIPVEALTTILQVWNKHLEKIELCITGAIINFKFVPPNVPYFYGTLANMPKNSGTKPTHEISFILNDKSLYNRWNTLDAKNPGNITIRGFLSISKKNGYCIRVKDFWILKTAQDLLLERQKTIAALKSEYLYDKNRIENRPPVYFESLWCISSTDADGYKDFINILEQHGQGIQIHTLDIRVQGEQMRHTVSQAFAHIQAHTTTQTAVFIVRGGGSELDLYDWNHYEVAKLIANCALPVYTGLGHTKDMSIADEVAYQNYNTPTAAGHFVASYNHAAIQNVYVKSSQSLVPLQRKVRKQIESIPLLYSRVQSLLDAKLRQQAQLTHTVQLGKEKLAYILEHKYSAIQNHKKDLQAWKKQMLYWQDTFFITNEAKQKITMEAMETLSVGAVIHIYYFTKIGKLKHRVAAIQD